jgi:hypothetical protein
MNRQNNRANESFDCYEMNIKNSRLLTIYLIPFIDVLGLRLILPLLPYLAAIYRADATVVGWLAAKCYQKISRMRGSGRYTWHHYFPRSSNARPWAICEWFLVDEFWSIGSGAFSAILLALNAVFAYRRIIRPANHDQLAIMVG